MAKIFVIIFLLKKPHPLFIDGRFLEKDTPAYRINI